MEIKLYWTLDLEYNGKKQLGDDEEWKYLQKHFNTALDKALIYLGNKDISANVLDEEIKKYIVLEKTKIEEERMQKSIERKISQKKGQKEKKSASIEKIVVGSLVRLQQTKQTGKVLEIIDDEATVAFGIFKTKVEKRKLEFIQ